MEDVSASEEDQSTFGDQPEAPSRGEDNVKVAVRIRPLISKEKYERCRECVTVQKVDGEPPVIVIGKAGAFSFDYAFGPEDSQEVVYDNCCNALIEGMLRGVNATILAYGQTASGKTYSLGSCTNLSQTLETQGVIPRFVNSLFREIYAKSAKEQADVIMRVSYVELHNEEIKDLLDPISSLTSQTLAKSIVIREDKEHGIVTIGLKEVEVKKPIEVLRCLEKGSVFRATGATLMNEHSSRSHAIFSITTEIRWESSPNDTFVAKVRFVDLAGSERAKKTGSVGDRFKEGVNINQGLLALGNVISALGDPSLNKSHVPYRDSKLTRLLQDSLGGNSRTLMIACVSPADSNFGETLNTLKYANRTKNIKNKIMVNVNLKNTELVKLHEKIKTLQLELLLSRQIREGPGEKGADDAVEHIRRLQREIECMRIELEGTAASLREASEEALMYRIKYEHALHGQLGNVETVGDTGSPENEGDTRIQGYLAEIRSLKEEKARLQVRMSRQNSSADPEPDVEQQVREVFAMEEREEEEEVVMEYDIEDHLEEEKKEVADYEGTQKELMITNTELDTVIKEKQILLTKLQRQSMVFHSMKARYEVKCKELEASIKVAQDEKMLILEERQHAVELEGKKGDPRGERGEEHMSALAKKRSQLEGRLKEVNRQLSELRHRHLEAERLVRLKQQQETQMKKMEEEIDRLKGQKHIVLSRMRTEEQMHRNWRKAWNSRVRDLRIQNQELQKKSRSKDLLLKKKTAEMDKALRKIDALKETQNGKLNQAEVVKKKCWIQREMSRCAKVREANECLQRGLLERMEKVKMMEELVEEKKRLQEMGGKEALDEVNDQVETLDAQIEFQSENIAQLHNELLPFVEGEANNAALSMQQNAVGLVDKLRSLDEAKALVLALVETIEELKSDRDTLAAKHEEAVEESDKLRKEQGDQFVAIRVQGRTYSDEMRRLEELHTEKELSLLAEIDHTMAADMPPPTEIASTTVSRLLQCRNEQIALLQKQNEEFRDHIQQAREQKPMQEEPREAEVAALAPEVRCVGTMTYASPYNPLKEEQDDVAAALEDVMMNSGLDRSEVLENIAKKCVELLMRVWQDLGFTEEQQGGELGGLEQEVLRLCSRELEGHERVAENLRQEEEDLMRTLSVLPQNPWTSFQLPDSQQPRLHERVNMLRELCAQALDDAKEQLRCYLTELWGTQLGHVVRQKNGKFDQKILELQLRIVPMELDDCIMSGKGTGVRTLDDVHSRNAELFTAVREVRELLFQMDIDVANALLVIYPENGHPKLDEFQSKRHCGLPGVGETLMYLKDLDSKIELEIANLQARLVEQQLELDRDFCEEPADDHPLTRLKTLRGEVRRRDNKIDGKADIIRKFETCEALVKKIEEFEIGASQRHRLKGSSIQLLHEEQQRLRFRRKKERIVEDLVNSVTSWELTHGEKVVYKNVHLKEALHQDLADTKELGHMCLVNTFDPPRPVERDRRWPVVQSTPRGDREKMVQSTPREREKIVASTPRGEREKMVQSTPREREKIVASTPREREKVVAFMPRCEVTTPRMTPRTSSGATTPRTSSKPGMAFGISMGPRPLRLGTTHARYSSSDALPLAAVRSIERRQTMPTKFYPPDRALV